MDLHVYVYMMDIKYVLIFQCYAFSLSDRGIFFDPISTPLGIDFKNFYIRFSEKLQRLDTAQEVILRLSMEERQVECSEGTINLTLEWRVLWRDLTTVCRTSAYAIHSILQARLRYTHYTYIWAPTQISAKICLLIQIL
jgi:hypothetical protein